MIRLDQPRRWDLVGGPMVTEGSAGDWIALSGTGTGFEATFAYRISEGHDELTGYIMAGGGSGEHAQFQIVVDVSGARFQLDRLFVEVFEVSMKDGEELNKTIRPVLLGSRMVEGYYGYRLHEVKPGDTLTGIAREHYGQPDWDLIYRANVHELADDEAGQTIYPGEILRVPIGGGSEAA